MNGIHIILGYFCLLYFIISYQYLINNVLEQMGFGFARYKLGLTVTSVGQKNVGLSGSFPRDHERHFRPKSLVNLLRLHNLFAYIYICIFIYI